MKRALWAVALTVAAALVLAPIASAIDKVNTQKLRKGVTLGGILEHERAFQDIANANDDTRAATTPGYDASVDYVRRAARGGRLRRQARVLRLRRSGSRTGRRRSSASPPHPTTYVEDTDYIVSQFSAGGDVTADVFVAGNTEIPPAGRARHIGRAGATLRTSPGPRARSR